LFSDLLNHDDQHNLPLDNNQHIDDPATENAQTNIIIIISPLTRECGEIW